MAIIQYKITDSAVDPLRLNTVEDFELDIITDFNVSNHASRPSANAMDHKSSRGTYISSHDTFSISITFPLAKRPLYKELLDSLKDYQLAVLDSSDIAYENSIRFFKLEGNGPWQFQLVGCDHMSLSFQGKYFS